MNKKGFTMMELLISIALTAIVMVFLVRLLVDVKYDRVNELYNTSNQINRAEIIKTIENDFNGKNITKIDDLGSSATNLKINIRSNSGIGTIEVDSSNNFKYTSTVGNVKKWELKKENSETFIKKTNIVYNIYTLPNSDYSYFITLNIPVVIDEFIESYDSDLVDSPMDNFYLTFYGTYDADNQFFIKQNPGGNSNHIVSSLNKQD